MLCFVRLPRLRQHCFYSHIVLQQRFRLQEERELRTVVVHIAVVHLLGAAHPFHQRGVQEDILKPLIQENAELCKIFTASTMSAKAKLKQMRLEKQRQSANKLTRPAPCSITTTHGARSPT